MGLPRDGTGVSVQVGLWSNVHIVDVGATATETSLSIESNWVRLWADVDAFILRGSNPTAATTDTPIGAKTAEYMAVAKGVDKISALFATATGTLWITEQQ